MYFITSYVQEKIQLQTLTVAKKKIRASNRSFYLIITCVPEKLKEAKEEKSKKKSYPCQASYEVDCRPARKYFDFV